MGFVTQAGREVSRCPTCLRWQMLMLLCCCGGKKLTDFQITWPRLCKQE